MNNPLDITTIILTFNEELHIRRCLENVRQFSREIFIIDCFSSDKTEEIAREMGAQVIRHAWPGNQAEQFNWALENCEIKTAWILRLDADEYLYPETIRELFTRLPELPPEVTSLSMSRARVWMGRRLRFGGTGKVILKRFFRTGTGRSELRLMDECIVTDYGQDLLLKGEFADDNLHDCSIWTKKHLDYANREAATQLDLEYGLSMIAESDLKQNTGKASAAMRHKKHCYNRLPLFWRAFFYFLYRYFLRLGFLEGKEGFGWHFFQGLWYRMMVDAKILEIKKVCGDDPEKIRAYIQNHYHISLR